MTDSPAKPFDNCYWVPGYALLAGEYPGDWSMPGMDEKLAALLDVGISVFIDLTRAEDGLEPYAPALAELAVERDVDVLHRRMPIQDFGVTTPDHMRQIVDAIDGYLAEGKKVYVHCWGGVGRTGTVVGCFLVRHGMDGDAALNEVRDLFTTMAPWKVESHPEGSPQNSVQRAMVRSWSE